MTYIPPQGVITLYSNIPFDTGYRNQTKFESLYAQSEYFSQHAVHTLSEQSYQRETKGTMKVGLTVSELLDCNYLSFNSGSGFSNKTYYCFITDVEYVNNATTKITYALDYIQSFQFDFSIRQCMVEREHVLVDTVGIHNIPEGIDEGELVRYGVDHFDTGDNIYLLHSLVLPTDVSKVGGAVYNGISYAGHLYAFDSIVDFTTATQHISDTDDGYIIGAFVMPSIAVDRTNMLVHQSTSAKVVGTLKTDRLWSFGDYTPKNKKLFCYPYYQIHLSNNNGTTIKLMPERFHDDPSGVVLTEELKFNILSAINDGVSMMCYPLYYNLNPNAINYGVALKPYPSVQMQGNPLASYFNQNSNSLVNNVATTGITTMLQGMATGTLLGGSVGSIPGAIGGAVVGTASALVNVWSTTQDLKNKPHNVIGNSSCGAITSVSSTLTTNGKDNTFSVYHMSMTRDRIKALDSYFDMLGYRVNEVKVPNINTRPYWNYVKTNGATVDSSLPYDIEDKICKILDNGITFWKNPDNVGDYSLDNH